MEAHKEQLDANQTPATGIQGAQAHYSSLLTAMGAGDLWLKLLGLV